MIRWDLLAPGEAKEEPRGQGPRRAGPVLSGSLAVKAQACPAWMPGDQHTSPLAAAPFPVRREVTDFHPGVWGRMGQAAWGVGPCGEVSGVVSSPRPCLEPSLLPAPGWLKLQTHFWRGTGVSLV